MLFFFFDRKLQRLHHAPRRLGEVARLVSIEHLPALVVHHMAHGFVERID